MNLGLIANCMCEWEGRVADELMLSPADAKEIKEDHKNSFNQQK